MADRASRVALLAAALLCIAPRPAHADWYFTPFIGYDLHGSTTFVDPEYGGRDRSKVTIGGSAALLVGVLGLEADYGYTPGFFENPACDRTRSGESCPLGPLITHSHVQTLTANVMLAAPLAWTHESLRPYIVGGVGVMDVVADDISSFFPVNSNLTAFDLGGGAIGMLGTRTGLRFDIRRFTNLDRDTPSGGSIGGPARLHFWRATVGVTLRY